MRYLLDSNTVIAIPNRRSDLAVARLAVMRAGSALSSIVMHELAFGAYNSLDPITNLRKIHARDLPALELTKADAIQAGRIRATLKQLGTQIGRYDLLTGGKALTRDLTLVTNNTREFERVAGLTLEDWTQP